MKSPTTIALARRRFELMAREHAILVGRRIAQARKEAHLTQAALAQKIPGKSDGTQVSKWERGVHQPGDDTLGHIGVATGRTVAWFHTSPDKPKATPALMEALAEPTQLDKIQKGVGDVQRDLTRLIERLVAAGVLAAVAKDTKTETPSAPAKHPPKAA